MIRNWFLSGPGGWGSRCDSSPFDIPALPAGQTAASFFSPVCICMSVCISVCTGVSVYVLGVNICVCVGGRAQVNRRLGVCS